MPEKELTPITGSIEIPVDWDTYEEQSVGSRFVDEAGWFPVEMGMPMWHDEGRSIAFPFVITGGRQKGKEDRIVAGISAEAFWKIKELGQACAFEVKKVKGKDKKDHPQFNPADVPGKTCEIRYVGETVDSKKYPGTQITLYKPKNARPIGAVVEETN